jgi:uncharacterized protein (UPF0335 family)
MTDGNGGPLAGLQGYLTEIDRQDDELATLRAEYMNECKGPRGHIKDILTSAREAGVNMKAFREILSKHRDDRRHEARVAALEYDDEAAFNEMVVKLGDFIHTPLGSAAAAKVRPLDGEVLSAND